MLGSVYYHVTPSGARLSDSPNRHDRFLDDFIVPAKVRFLEADGYRWRVHEVTAPEFDRRKGGTHLLFYAETIMRRVRDFPANWDDLSDEALYALTDQHRTRD